MTNTTLPAERELCKSLIFGSYHYHNVIVVFVVVVVVVVVVVLLLLVDMFNSIKLYLIQGVRYNVSNEQKHA